MAVKSLKIWPSLSLKAKAAPVTDLNSQELQELIQDLKETATAYSAQGIAATQIGVPLQVMLFVDEAGDMKTLINPQIVAKEGDIVSREGCLSFPGVHVRIKRFHSISVQGIQESGDHVVFNLYGLPAVAFQHELDHLNGVTMLDHLGRLEKKLVLKKLEKTKKKLGVYK